MITSDDGAFSPSVIRSSSNHLKTGGENVLHPTLLTHTLVHSISKTRADATLWVIKGYKAESHNDSMQLRIHLDFKLLWNGEYVDGFDTSYRLGGKQIFIFEGIVISAPVSLDPSLIYFSSRTAPFTFRATLNGRTTNPNTAALQLLAARGRQKR